MKNSLINQIKTLLGMDVKLEQMKLADKVTVLEAESFEAEKEIVIVTEDDQKIPLPVGEYEMENGQILVVKSEGVISEMKEMEKEEEKEMPKEEIEIETEKKEEMETAKTTPKKTIESSIKETFFAEIEALKTENETLKAELAKINEVTETELSEVKPISFNPENNNPIEITRLASKKPRSIMDSILEKINK